MLLKRTVFIIAVVATLLVPRMARAQWSDSLTDNNGAKTVIANDAGTPTQPIAIYGDPVSHAMMVLTATSAAFFASPEWDNAAVTGSSGADLNPASASYGFCFQNATASTVFMKLGSDAGNWDGFRVEAGGNRCVFGIEYSTFSVWTPSAATMSVEHWRY